MKIIILVRILWASGAQKIAIEEAKTLTQLGHEVKLVFLRETESGKLLEPTLASLDYEIFSTRKPSWVYSTITGMFMPDRKGEGALDYNLLQDYPKTVTPNEADLIICHDPWAGIAGYRINKKLNIPYSIFYHEGISGEYPIPLLGRFAKRTEENVLKKASKIFGVTAKVANSVRRVYEVEVIPNFPGMNLQEYDIFNDKQDVLVASATWDKNRDPTKYIDILDELPDFTLYIVGRWRSGTEYQDFLNLLSSRKLSNRVIIEDRISESKLQTLYKKAKFNLRYGTNEMGPGMSNIESISHLTPIVVDSVLGISDLIIEYGGGGVVDTWNSMNVSAYIRENNNELNYKKLQNQLLKIVNQFTWEKHSNILLDTRIK
jgi:glycosyltransferase involved in cell wall biosynthesis